MIRGTYSRWLLPTVATLAGFLILFFVLPGGPQDWVEFILDQDRHPGLFIALMILLPMLGFPISPFLIMVAIKFGPFGATAVTALIFALHLVAAYLLAHSVLRPQISKLLSKVKYSLPEIQQRRRLPFSLIFMALPGLPYTVKNYILATLNIPFRIYFPVGLGCNLLLALPFIGLGHTAIQNPKLVIVFLVVLAAGYVAAVWLKRKMTASE
jgi:uncharacterized membrane protein YdjX (TVP38/TMEM64 family)